MRALGGRYRSNALAQEKTGEFWVNARCSGAIVRGDFEHAEVALFIGKNPWQSHGIPHARVTLKEIARDPERALIVIDPRRSETAELADFHLQVRPGTDAWCLAALVAVLVQEGLVAALMAGRARRRLAEIEAPVRRGAVADHAPACGVDEELLRATARRIAAASSVAAFEDLGIQMNRHSTLSSYLEKLLWLLTGNFGKPGAQYSPTSLVALARGDSGGRGGRRQDEPGRRRPDHRRARAVQRHRRGDPHRPSPIATARCSSRAPTRRTPWPTAADARRRWRRWTSWSSSTWR